MKKHLKRDLYNEKPDITKIRGRPILAKGKIRCRRSVSRTGFNFRCKGTVYTGEWHDLVYVLSDHALVR